AGARGRGAGPAPPAPPGRRGRGGGGRVGGGGPPPPPVAGGAAGPAGVARAEPGRWQLLPWSRRDGRVVDCAHGIGSLACVSVVLVLLDGRAHTWEKTESTLTADSVFAALPAALAASPAAAVAPAAPPAPP